MAAKKGILQLEINNHTACPEVVKLNHIMRMEELITANG